MAKPTNDTAGEAVLKRLDYLEEAVRWYAFALDVVASMVRMHGSRSPHEVDQQVVIRDTRLSLHRMIELTQSAFYTVNPVDCGFDLVDCEPDSSRSSITTIVDGLIETGEFSWALQQSRAVLVKSRLHRGVVVLHSLATANQVLGMFVGCYSGSERELTSSRLNLLSILLHNCSYALESTALQLELRNANRGLELRVEEAISHITLQNQELVTKVEALKRAEEALTVAKQAAEAANHAKSRFLATMSHEIRTPMNAIIGMAQLLAETELSVQQRSYVDIFKRAGESLLSLINDILDLSKIEAGKLELERTCFNLHETVGDVVQIFSLRAKEKGLELVIQIAHDVPAWITGDSMRLRQILVNLIGNAIKFTSRGWVAVEVIVMNRWLRFAVADSGIGIPRGKQDAIFAEFTQADSSTTRQYGGTGLGLTISQRLVAGMGGKIWLESDENQGSIFYFILPDTACTPHGGGVCPKPVARSEPPEPSAATARLAEVLLAEDSEDNVLLVKLFLNNPAWRVTVAENGRRAVEQFREKKFDLVLMDMQMPVMDGFEATAQIRDLERERGGPATPILALTAYAFQEDRQRCLDAGCDDYLSKPIKKQELIAAIRRYLA